MSSYVVWIIPVIFPASNKWINEGIKGIKMEPSSLSGSTVLWTLSIYILYHAFDI